MIRPSRYNTAVEVAAGRVAIHNGVSGETALLDAAEWSRVEDFCAGVDDGGGLEEQLERLVRGRFLTLDSVDELAVLRSRYLAGRAGGGLGLTIVTSLGCNFDCPYCFEDKRPSLLKPAVADAIVGLLDDTLQTPRLDVTWMGGEPLIGLTQLLALSTRLMERCDAREIPYSAGIVTNGWHLDGPTAALLAAHRVRNAQITIDGPADVHDRYRPVRNGGSTYERVIANAVAASEHLKIAVRMNVDRGNLGRAEELLADLARRGAAGRIAVVPARMTTVVSNPNSPVASYGGACFSSPEFAAAELEFERLALRNGFDSRPAPRAIGTPCTAVRATEVVVGPDGELWKCWDEIGDETARIGSIFDYRKVSREGVGRWLGYDPFSDDQCSTCIALPGCMGGCAHHQFHSDDPDERCGSFRHNHRERVRLHGRRLLGLDVSSDPLEMVDTCRSAAASAAPAAHGPVPVPVSLGRRS